MKDTSQSFFNKLVFGTFAVPRCYAECVPSRTFTEVTWCPNKNNSIAFMLEKHRWINDRGYLAKKKLMFSNHNSQPQSNHSRSSSRSRFEVSGHYNFVSVQMFFSARDDLFLSIQKPSLSIVV